MKPFNPEFESEVFGYLFFDKDKKRKDARERVKAEKLVTYLPADLFQTKEIHDLYGIAKKMFNDSNNRLPTVNHFEQELYNRYSQDEGTYTYYKGIFQKCVGSIDPSEIDYIRENIEKRIKFEYNKQQLEEVLESFKNNRTKIYSDEDYAKILKRVTKSTTWQAQDLSNAKLNLTDEDFELLLSDNYRAPIPTGIDIVDEPTNGGLGKGELGLILAEKGLGKTTILTKIANNAYSVGMNVLHIVFEDRREEILRKHFAIWSGLSIKELNYNKDRVKESYRKHFKNANNNLFIIRAEQGKTTVAGIKAILRDLEVENECRIDMVVIDYVDCVAPEKTTGDNKFGGQEEVIRDIEGMCFAEDVAVWSAVQSNRQAYGESVVTAKQMGGSVARAIVAHFVMTFGRTPEQKSRNQATAFVEKCRFGEDKILFENIHLDNKRLVIQKNPPYINGQGGGNGIVNNHYNHQPTTAAVTTQQQNYPQQPPPMIQQSTQQQQQQNNPSGGNIANSLKNSGLI